MTASKITQEQVNNACNLLISQGKKPTIDAVRVTLGNTGSKSTIVSMVRIWREQNPDLAYNSKQFIPMTDEVLGKFQEAWTLAVMQAEQRTDNDYIVQLETENEKLREEIMKYQKIEAEFQIVKESQGKFLEALQKSSEEIGQLKKKVQELEQKK